MRTIIKDKFTYITIIFLFLLGACTSNSNNNNQNIQNNSFFKSTIKKENNKIIYNKENYHQKAIDIIEDGKRELKDILPNLINEEIKIFEHTLEGSAAQAINFSSTLTDKNIKEIHINAGVNMLEKEIIINQVYYNIINKLADLNDLYFNHFIEINKEINFTDYFTANKFILAEEVAIKVDELVKAEKIRNNKERRNMGLQVGLSLVELIPGTKACSIILEGIIQGARAAKVGGKLSKNAKCFAKLTSTVLTKKTAIKLTRKLSNIQKRERVAKRLAIIGGTATISQFSLTMKDFKSADNKIEGRIGDFSDGMIAVHIQELREIIKKNEALIKN